MKEAGSARAEASGNTGLRLETAQDYLERVICELRALSSERKGELLGVSGISVALYPAHA